MHNTHRRQSVSETLTLSLSLSEYFPLKGILKEGQSLKSPFFMKCPTVTAVFLRRLSPRLSASLSL